MKYHALFVIFEKAVKFEIVVCSKKIGGASRVNNLLTETEIRHYTCNVTSGIFHMDDSEPV